VTTNPPPRVDVDALLPEGDRAEIAAALGELRSVERAFVAACARARLANERFNAAFGRAKRVDLREALGYWTAFGELQDLVGYLDAVIGVVTDRRPVEGLRPELAQRVRAGLGIA
jgi:hypothetical protein